MDVLSDRDLTLHVISEHPPAAATAQADLGSARAANRLALLQQSQLIRPQY